MNTNEIVDICKQLVAEGKQPSVALVKPRMRGPKQLPNIIAGIKLYNSDPNMKVQAKDTEETPVNSRSVEERISILERQVQLLTDELKKLTK